MFRVAAVLNKPEREAPTMEAIRKHLRALSADIEMRFFEYNDADYLRQMVSFQPDVIFSYPYTARGISGRSYLLKHLFGCFNVCLRTEGQYDYRHGNKNAWLVGMEEYGATFVDYELFWSRKIAEMTGGELVRQRKLSGMERVKVFGYPPYEEHFRPWNPDEDTLPPEHRGRMEAYPRERVITFITNFCFADYSAQDILGAGDLIDLKNADVMSELAAGVEGSRRCAAFRQMWIESIQRTAFRNPDALIVVKSHPVEHIIFERKGRNPYREAFSGLSNIVYIHEPMRIVDLLIRSGLFLHYGSTCLAESYLQGVPSVFVTSRELYGEGKDPSNPNFFFHDSGWESTLRTDIKDVPLLAEKHLREPVQFVMRPHMRTVLRDIFNIEEEHLSVAKSYEPSKDIARFIGSLKDKKPQSIATDDKGLQTALTGTGFSMLDALVVSGAQLMDEEQNADALNVLSKALLLCDMLDVDFPELSQLRAVCMMRLGLRTQALKALAQAEKLPREGRTVIHLPKLSEERNEV